MNRTKQLGLSLLTLLCCLTATAQDPSVTKCEYWFDQQYDSRITATMSGGTWDSSISIADMGYGLHSIAFRVFDSNGQASSTLVKNFIKLESTSTGINPLNTYEYWIDQQFDKRKSGTVPASGVVSFEEDLTTLNYGLHNVTVRVIDAVGKVSSALTKNFIKLETTATGTNPLKTYEYWIDQQFDKRKSETLDATGIVNIDEDITALDYGLHNVTIRVIDAVGRVSSALTKNFIKLETTASGLNPLKTYEYWIDQQFDERKSGTVPATGVVEFDYDLSALNPGLHNIAIRVIDEVGKVSSVLTKNFIVLEQLEGDNALVTYEYWIDDEFDSRKSAEVPADGVVNLDIDITDRGVGMHTFNYRTIDKAGYPSAVVYKSFFVKKIVEDANLIAIDYWFNDEPRTRIAIDPAQASIDKNDIVIPLDDLKPRTISEEYVFDATQKKVITTETVTVGFQVFNNEEVGSEAYVETLENMSFTVDPAFVALNNEVSDTKAVPKGGDVQGFSYSGAVGDSLHWEITTESDAKIDFYDADGNKITPEAKTINEKDVLVMKMPTATVYVLVYGATADGDITIKVAQPIELAVVDATRKYGEANPTFTYSVKGAAVAGEVAFTTEATATSGVGDYAVSIDGSGITNSYVTLVPGTLTIEKAPLTIKAKDYTIKQGEALPALEIEYEGFKNEETQTVLTTQAAIATEATSASVPGAYDITVSGAEAANYELTFLKGTLTIEKLDVILGDANGDGTVNVFDVTAMVNYILGSPNEGFVFAAADVNGDGIVNVFDVTKVVNIILGVDDSEAKTRKAEGQSGTDKLYFEDFEIEPGEEKEVNILLDNPGAEYRDLQFDLYLPEGITVVQDEDDEFMVDKGDRCTKKHTIGFSYTDGHYVCMLYSTAKNPLSGNSGDILTITLKADGNVAPGAKTGSFRNVSLSKTDATGPTYDEFSFGITVKGADGIADLDANMAPADIYTLQGIKVRSKSESLDGLADGYYIVNRRKVYIRRK